MDQKSQISDEDLKNYNFINHYDSQLSINPNDQP